MLNLWFRHTRHIIDVCLRRDNRNPCAILSNVPQAFLSISRWRWSLMKSLMRIFTAIWLFDTLQLYISCRFQLNCSPLTFMEANGAHYSFVTAAVSEQPTVYYTLYNRVLCSALILCATNVVCLHFSQRISLFFLYCIIFINQWAHSYKQTETFI